MNNKNILSILIILAVVVVALLIFLDDEATAPATAVDTTVVESTDYVEMTIAEAQAKAQAEGVLFRVVEEDGNPLPTTKDFQVGRISAKVEDGLVTSYTVETNNPVLNVGGESDQDETVATANNDAIIGMSVAEAEAYADSQEIPFRVTMLDGEGLPATMDYLPGRISAEVENDVVVGYTVE